MQRKPNRMFEQDYLLSKSIGKVNKAIIGIEEENIAKQIQKINYGGESIG